MIATLSHADIRQLAHDSRIAYTRALIHRMDAPRAIVSGRMQTWRERLNRMVFASRSWQGLETIERRHLSALHNRRVRCEVYEANNH